MLKSGQLPPPLATWENEMQENWKKFGMCWKLALLYMMLTYFVAAFQKKEINANDLLLVQQFFEKNYKKILSGDTATFSEFTTIFQIPEDSNNTKKRKK